jgi:glycosyltransferase involved in cell wall biosynthesis
VYCADLDAYLQDAIIIIAALSELDTPRPDLVMIGRASPDAENAIRDAVRRANMQDTVVIQTEYIPSDALRSLYAGAEALLAPLHDDDRSKARFPFKIADYLLSGRPVVSCNVGEVARFLRDGETAFLCEPDDVQAFAFKIHESLTHTDRDTIAMRGKRLAEGEFDYRIQGARLLDFLSEFVEQR